jgi:hypothetical protein
MKYPATWPGTAVIKSMHSPFNWKHPRSAKADHLLTSQRASEAGETTTAFNQWRALMASAPKSALTWPEYLAQYNATAEAKASKAKRRAEMTEQVPQHLHLHSLGEKVTSVERTKAHRAKLIGKPNHARSQ